jgi:hypothetical protein
VPEPDARWQHLGPALLGAISTGHLSDPLKAYSQMISTFRNDDPSGFNQHLSEYDRYLSKMVPQELVRPNVEVLFNQSAPFLQAMILYVVVFLFAALSWLFWPGTLSKTAGILLVVAFLHAWFRYSLDRLQSATRW